MLSSDPLGPARGVRRRPRLGGPGRPGHAGGRAAPPVAALHPDVLLRRRRGPGHRARLRAVRVRPEGQALPGRAGRPVREPDRARPQGGRRGGRAAGQRAGLLPALVLRPPAGHRAGRAAGPPGPGRPEPGVLHHQRLRGGRVGLEAGQAVLQDHRRAGPVQGAQPRHRLPRHVDGRAGHHRAAADQGAVRAAPAGRGPGAEHQLLPGARVRGRRPRPGSAAGRPTRSSAPSCARARSRWPRCSWSRCRTRAGASRRRPATSTGSARSATATASSWSPTRSSARSAGSVTTSARSATTTSRTSSPSPRASPPATRRSAA